MNQQTNSLQYHGLINGVGGLVGEDAGGEAGDDLLHAELVARVQDVIGHEDVVAKEVQVGPHVVEQTPNLVQDY